MKRALVALSAALVTGCQPDYEARGDHVVGWVELAPAPFRREAAPE